MTDITNQLIRFTREFLTKKQCSGKLLSETAIERVKCS